MTDTVPPAWLSIIGIGEDGIAGLGDKAKQIISESTTVYGGKRHLTLMRSLITGHSAPWPSPFDDAIKAVHNKRGQKTCILASGNPFFFGVGATLARIIPANEMLVIPAPSSFSLAAARLGWALQDVETVSLHGKPIDLIRPLLHPGRRILALTSDADAAPVIAQLLTRHGFGRSAVTILEALGGSAERIRRTMAADFDLADLNPLNVMAIEVDGDGAVIALASGLDDDFFEHDGQITKREIRAISLSSLAPRRGELLWDIGAGSGSIAIEWMLAHPSMRAIAIEAEAERAARAQRNAVNCGVPGLQIATGQAPAALHGLPAPDAIFIGGGGTDPGVFELAIGSLKAGGRLVANAVTIDTERLLIEHHSRLGGRLIRVAVSRAAPVGSMTGWKPAMPVTQWVWTKS